MCMFVLCDSNLDYATSVCMRRCVCLFCVGQLYACFCQFSLENCERTKKGVIFICIVNIYLYLCVILAACLFQYSIFSVIFQFSIRNKMLYVFSVFHFFSYFSV